jgi:hypothetical protein
LVKTSIGDQIDEVVNENGVVASDPMRSNEKRQKHNELHFGPLFVFLVSYWSHSGKKA